MKKIFSLSIILTLLGGCVYTEDPSGRYAAIDLPIHNQTTIHKTVTINAPAGTTVNISETPPPTVIYSHYPRRPPNRCHYDANARQRICYH